MTEPKPYFSCRITTSLTTSICPIKHHDLARAQAHGKKILRGLDGRALMVEIVGPLIHIKSPEKVER